MERSRGLVASGDSPCFEIQHTIDERYANGLQILGPGFEHSVAFQTAHILLMNVARTLRYGRLT
jgi:hypothetical protein